MTQREVVARLAERGNQTTNRGLSAMENGRGLDLGLLPELSIALRCTVTYLLGLTPDPQSWRPSANGTPVRHVPTPRDSPRQGTGILGPDVPVNWVPRRR